MTDTAPKPDAQVIVDTALIAAGPELIAGDRIAAFTLPAGATVHTIDLEQYQASPERKKGTAQLFTAESFARFVKTHDQGDVSIYADVKEALVEAVLNGDTADAAGWGDHRARLQLRHTDPWKHWTGRDGQLGRQQQFAEHIEQGLLEIVDPPAAEMLEIAQHFQANTNSEFRSSRLLQNGQVQLTYQEIVDAKAGATGQLTVPDTFTLALQPFEGSAQYKVKARLRYRVGGGQLAIGYQLDRPQDVLQAAFDDVVNEIAETTGLTPYAGKAPSRP